MDHNGKEHTGMCIGGPEAGDLVTNSSDHYVAKLVPCFNMQLPPQPLPLSETYKTQACRYEIIRVANGGDWGMWVPVEWTLQQAIRELFAGYCSEALRERARPTSVEAQEDHCDRLAKCIRAVLQDHKRTLMLQMLGENPERVSKSAVASSDRLHSLNALQSFWLAREVRREDHLHFEITDMGREVLTHIEQMEASNGKT